MGGSGSAPSPDGLNSSKAECRTEIKVAKMHYTWIIKNYLYCRKTTGQYLESTAFQTADNGNSKWCLRLYPKGVEERNADFVSLFLRLISSNECEVTAKLSFYLIDHNGKAANVFSSEHVFKKGSNQCGHIRYLERKQPPVEIKDILHDDEVKICCELNIVDTETSVEENKSPMVEIPPCRLSEDMERLFESEELSDFTVRCGAKEFHCHKAVLAARSPVILAMLKNVTRERMQNKVDILDIDENAIESLLRFIYTGKSPPKEKLTKELLIAADKYDIQRLKLMCEVALSSTLAVENAVELLTITDKYTASKLKQFVLQFIVKYAERVTGSNEWEELIFQNPKLVVELSRCFNYSKA